MRRDLVPLLALTFAPLGLACSEPEPLESLSVEPRAAEDEASERLDQSFVRYVDAGSEGWTESLDLSGFDPDATLRILVESTGSPATARLRLQATGEVIAEAELSGEIEEDGGPTRYVSTIDIAPSPFAEVDLELETVDPPVRLLLCDQMVTNRQDSGAGSLRAAVALVRTGLSVCFDPVEFAAGPPVQLASEIVIGRSLRIIGTPSGTAVVEATGAHRILQLGSSASLSLRELTFEGGEEVEGGIIASDGDLYLRDSSLKLSEAQRGGAIYSTGIVSIRDTELVHNEAKSGGGGAIYCDGCQLELDDAVVSHNVAPKGGGIYIDRGAMTMRSGSDVYHNTATLGGGIFIEGPFVDPPINTVLGGTIRTNVADEGGGVHLQSGRLWLETPAGAPDVVSGNVAFGFGGGILAGSTERFPTRIDLLDHATISGNIAHASGPLVDAGSGGGVYTFEAEIHAADHAEVSNNTAVFGGGIYTGGPLELTGFARLANNTASEHGGGLYTWGGIYSILTAPNVRIESNHAGLTGGGVATWGLFEYHPYQLVSNTAGDPAYADYAQVQAI